MALWGATTADEAKPKHLTDADKRDVYATDRGWTAPAGGNPNGEREVLVAIGSLSGATKLAEASISSITWDKNLDGPPYGDEGPPTFSHGNGGSMSLHVNFNEVVTVTDNPLGGTPSLTITSSNAITSTLQWEYLEGSGTNRLVFMSEEYEEPEAFEVGDVLSIGLNALNTLNGATITDTESTNNAVLNSSADMGALAGTVTIAA